jgi:hypothetical protein
VITTEESLAQSKESIGLLKKTGSIQRIKFNARRSFKVSHSKEQGYDAHRLQDTTFVRGDENFERNDVV